MRYITEDEVHSLLTIEDVAKSLADAFQFLAEGKAVYSPRNRITALDGILNTMPASIDPWHMTGMKTYFASKEGGKFVVIIFDSLEKELKYVIEASRLGQLRTGAVPALISSRILKEKDPVFALIGSGYQAETQLSGVLQFYEPSEIRVYSKHFQNAEKFAYDNSKKFYTNIKAVKTVVEAVAGANLVNCITNATIPIFSRKDLPDKYHVNLAGGNLPFRSEVELDVLTSSDVVIVESIEQGLKESKEIIDLVNEGQKDKMLDLKDFYSGNLKIEPERSVFKTMGIGLEDLAAAHALLTKMEQ